MGGVGWRGAAGGQLEDGGVRTRLPMTGEGRRVSDRVGTLGACPGGGGRQGEEDKQGGDGEAGFPAGGGGDSSNRPQLILCPASSDLHPPPTTSLCPASPPGTGEAVVMTMTAF